MNKFKGKKKNIIKRTMAFVVSAIMLIVAFGALKVVGDIEDGRYTANAQVPANTIDSQITLKSLQELYDFSEEYRNNPTAWQRANVTIEINDNIILEQNHFFSGASKSFYPIGTEEYPFGGIITISTIAGMDLNISVEEPLFDYVMDSVDVVNVNNGGSQRLNLLKQSDVSNGDTKALFANNVVHDSVSGATPATWDLIVNPSGTYSGVLGKVGSGSDTTVANLNLTLNTDAGIHGDDSVGLICGTINENSTVNVSFSAESSVTSVNSITSDSGSAGGFVGELAEDATLNLVFGSYELSSVDRVVTGNQYAGGLVGKNDGGIVIIKKSAEAEESKFETKGTIKGTVAAGGVFGYYRIISDTQNRFSPSYYVSSDVGCSLNGLVSGGIIGILDSEGLNVSYSGAQGNNLSVNSKLVSGVGVKNYGGIVGKYSNTDLTKSFEVEYVNVNMEKSGADFDNAYYGGAVASVADINPVYIKVNNFALNAISGADACKYFGGAVGGAGTLGSFIDVGNITVSVGNGTSNRFSGGGVLGQLTEGVLRLSGVTDMSHAVANNASVSNGQLVGERKNGLVFAPGTGEDANATYGTGWAFKRSNTDAYADDIGSWGEVVRVSDASIISCNETEHYVTIAEAVEEMSSTEDVVKTALNMQFNTGNNIGALHFENIGSSKKSTLLASTSLALLNDIDLSGTGITGFMRDGIVSGDDEVGSFTGKLSGNGNTISLAVGERYGIVNGASVPDTVDTGRGAIHGHKFSGLFARTGDGAEFEELTIDGYMNIRASVDDMNIGGAVASLRNGQIFTNVSAVEDIHYNHHSGNYHYLGGLIGKTNVDSGKKLSILGDSSNKTLVSPAITVTGSGVSSSDDKTEQCIGGMIGLMSSVAGSVANQTETEISDIILSATIDASGAGSADLVSTAGLIADFAMSTTDTRKLTLNRIDVKDTVIKNNATKNSGGILGFRWLGVDVELTDVILDSGDGNNEINTPSQYVGGLVYKATGNWLVNDNGIDINSLDIKNGTDAATPTGLGIIVHDGYKGTNGIFLEMLSLSSYTLAEGLTIPNMAGDGKIYDELVACLSSSADSILTNNTAGVISYATDGEYYMAGSGSRNSYNNVYNTTVVNNRSRYYYNVDRNNYDDSNDSYNLLFWSLNRYAASNIKRCFTNPFSNNVLTGTFDLNHISYYPIDISSNVTLGDMEIVFYNADIEATETAADTKKSTRDGKSQHYLMHMGLFRNVTAKVTTTGDITMSGSVGTNSTYSGALICGNLSGTLATSDTNYIFLGYHKKPKTRRPLELSDVNNNEADRYLLINSISDRAILNLSGVYIDSEANYDTSGNNLYASSLIGDVVGVGINLRFSRLTIDARNKENVVTDLDDVYGTERSIFKHATLLNKYDVDATSVAVYNFAEIEDWDGSTRLGQVTYGKELSDSIMYEDDEKQYYDDDRHYINPVSVPSDTPYAAGFSDDFLPYVRYYSNTVTGAPAAENIEYMLREIKVNVLPTDLSVGCGTYDDPYVISGRKQLEFLASMIDDIDVIPSIRLPIKANKDSHWCKDSSDATTCALFSENGTGTTYTSTDSTDTWSKNEVRAYLVNAYYQVDSSIELSANFKGLGAYNSDYAFKGVIVGKTEGITITNKSIVPFIKVSNGSVVKDLAISVNAGTNNILISSPANTSAYTYGNDAFIYGGVIGKIMGGDNVIDNVSVTYNKNLIKVYDKYLYNVGGYVGAIVNGGLIFRNMTASNFNASGLYVNTTNNASGTNFAAADNYKHLYINPYIGRVINGYAINETNSYSGDTETYTLNNNTKNYQIADVNVSVTDSGKLYYDTFDSMNRVNIPDGQSLFILSLITQSGAGTAVTPVGDYEYDVAYDGNTQYNSTTAAKNVATHIAKYDKVGNASFTDKSGDYALVSKDANGSKKAIPYIIYHYTKKDTDNNYPARMMTGNTQFMRLSTAEGTYNLPNGFRGIGAMCYAGKGKAADAATDNPYQMHIYGLDGNGATINEQLIFNAFVNDKDNYVYKLFGTNNINFGMGLFNVLIQKSKGTGTTYDLTEGYYVGDFVLTGQVTIKEYSEGGVLQGGGFNTTNSSTGAQSPERNRYAVGGLAGGVLGSANNENPLKYINLYNLDLNNLVVTGTSFVGGYIGRNNITEIDGSYGAGKNYIFANGCDTTAVELYGSNGCCGGIIGGSMSGYPSVYVNTAELKDGDSHLSGDDGYYKSVMELNIENDAKNSQAGIGGIIGCLRNGYQVTLWINNVTVKGGGEKKRFYNNNNGNTTVYSAWSPGAGGLFGFVRKADSVIITNCEIKDLNIKAPLAGGLFGNIDFFDDKPEYGTSPVIKIANCKITSSDASIYSIEGIKGAGGITGQFTSSKAFDKTVTGYDGNVYSYDVDGCEVSKYTISQTGNTDELCGAGGLFGFARATYVSSSDYKMRTVVNTSVHDCIIKTDGLREKHGMGAIVGCVPTIDSGTTNSGKAVIDDTGVAKSTAKACGNVGAYNVACYNNSFEYNGIGTSAKCGNFVGQSNGSTFKIVGFTRKNNTKSGSPLTDDYGGTVSNSYVIDADYLNISIGNGHGTSMAVGFDNGTNVGEGAAKNYFPYVTVSPKVNMGSDGTLTNFLTGDGMSLVDDSPVAKIITAENTGTAADNRIAYKTVSDTDIGIVNDMIAWGEDESADHDIKLTTYFKEMGIPSGYQGDDFPIIAIGGGESGYSSYINAYVRTLTNTQDSYVKGIAGKFNIDIYPCQCIDGVYQKVEGDDVEAGFKLDTGSGTYFMDDENADSVAGNNQFSMIDISFLDPTDSSKVAYHLYVPVLTKKTLKFDFSSSALLGSEYEMSDYVDKFPEEWGDTSKLAAGFDSWQTILVQYDYPKDEINKFLNTGKGLDWNIAKELQFKYNGNKSLAETTQFVLLDNNNNVDKEYYISKDHIDTETNSTNNKYDVIKFEDFVSDDDSPYNPQTLNDIADDLLVYSQDTIGQYMLCADQVLHEDAIIYAYDRQGENKLYFKPASGSGERYKIEVTDVISETYYLSMYTYSSDNTITETTHNAYAFVVECPGSFTNDIITCQKSRSKNTEVYIGDFLKQTVSIRDVNQTVTMNSDNNHVLYATIESTIEFYGDSATYFHRQLAGEELYQGFYLYLNRYDVNGIITDDSSIKGKPYYSYERTVNGEAYGTAGGERVEGEPYYIYIPPVKIVVPDYSSGWTSVQTATVRVDFDSEKSLTDEFPTRITANDLYAIGIDASSKLEFVSDRVPYSNNVQTVPVGSKPRQRYYIDKSGDTSILKLTAIDQTENDEYDTYGEQSHNRSELGINGKYISTGKKFKESELINLEHVITTMDYDISGISEDEIFDDTHKLLITIRLDQKNNTNADPGYEYVPVNISDKENTTNTGYLRDFKLLGKTGNALPLTSVQFGGDGYLYYTYEFELDGESSTWPIRYSKSETEKHFVADLEFNVKTDELLEAIPGYKYANYKLDVKAQIIDSNDIAVYGDNDWVVYTNARVNAQYVKSH